ncbi:hypothetical protein JYQ62_21715 [Nostoc sp. UHCC 0702]|nr:hypothetical protein JYQ62_21715 [Nostoc sp. UHCC 0702]
MTIAISISPKFNHGQMVGFIGGVGTIKNYRPESGSWVYLVEMEMELEPEIDRIGYETMIWLSELEICSLTNNFSHNLSG